MSLNFVWKPLNHAWGATPPKNSRFVLIVPFIHYIYIDHWPRPMFNSCSKTSPTLAGILLFLNYSEVIACHLFKRININNSNISIPLTEGKLLADGTPLRCCITFFIEPRDHNHNKCRCLFIAPNKDYHPHTQASIVVCVLHIRN